MAWKFTIHNMKPEHALSVTDINDNFIEIIDEMGSLNEQNWNDRFLFRVDLTAGETNEIVNSIADDASYVINQTARITNPNYDLEHDFDDAEMQANLSFELNEDGGWNPIPFGGSTAANNIEMQFATKGGMLWIMASFQYSSGTAWFGFPQQRVDLQTWNGTGLVDPLDAVFHSEDGRLAINTRSYGAEFAIQIDGTIIPESILGSGESSVQDPAIYGQYHERPSGVSQFPEDYQGPLRGSTRGCWGDRLPCVVEAIVPVAPGIHTIKVVARVPKPLESRRPASFEGWNVGDVYPHTANPGFEYVPLPLQWVTNRELIVIEILR